MRRKLATEQAKRHWRLACKTTSVTVSPVIPTAPAQPAARKAPSSGSNEQSKDFYNILCSSTQDAAEELLSLNVSGHTAKTGKSEKQSNKKNDTEQAMMNLTVPPATPQSNQTAPVLSLAALLGLPAHPSADVAETGKAEDNNGQAVLAPLQTGSYQQPAANTVVTSQETKPDSSVKIQPALIKTEPGVHAELKPSTRVELKDDQPQSLQKTDPIPAAPSAEPTDLPVAATSQQPVVAPSAENKQDAPQPNGNASTVASIPSTTLSGFVAPQQTLKIDIPPSNVIPPKESSQSSSPQKDRNGRTIAGVGPIPPLNVAPPQQLTEAAPLQQNSRPNSSLPASATVNSAANKGDIDVTTAGASPSVASSAPPGSNLAFALRLSENPSDSKLQSPSQEAVPAQPTTHAAVPASNADGAINAVSAVIESQEKSQSHQHDNSAGTPLYEVSQVRPQSASETSQGNSPEQPAHTTAAGLDPKHEMTSSEPVRNVHMQVIGEDNSRVDVRLMDRGGALHISVKSGDTNLAQNLQDHLPELTSRLEQQRFQAEVWIPKAAESTKTEMSGTRDFSSSSNNNSNANSGNSDGQGKKQQQYQPDWVDVLENSTRGTGKIDQTWLQ